MSLRTNGGKGKVEASCEIRIHRSVPQAHKVGHKIQNEKDLCRRYSLGILQMDHEFVNVGTEANEDEGSEYCSGDDNVAKGPRFLYRSNIIVSDLENQLRRITTTTDSLSEHKDRHRHIKSRDFDPRNVRKVSRQLAKASESNR